LPDLTPESLFFFPGLILVIAGFLPILTGPFKAKATRQEFLINSHFDLQRRLSKLENKLAAVDRRIPDPAREPKGKATEEAPLKPKSRTNCRLVPKMNYEVREDGTSNPLAFTSEESEKLKRIQSDTRANKSANKKTGIDPEGRQKLIDAIKKVCAKRSPTFDWVMTAEEVATKKAHKPRSKNKPSGLPKGVKRAANCFIGQTTINGKYRCSERFNTAEEAHQWYLDQRRLNR